MHPFLSIIPYDQTSSIQKHTFLHISLNLSLFLSISSSSLLPSPSFYSPSYLFFSFSFIWNNWKDFKINILPCLWYLILKLFSLHILRFPWLSLLFKILLYFFFAILPSPDAIQYLKYFLWSIVLIIHVNPKDSLFLFP